MTGYTKVAAKANQPERERSRPTAHGRQSDASTLALLNLQQAAGNLAMQRLLRDGVIQAKLTISQPNDPYEQEAERVAEAVMGMATPRNLRAVTGFQQARPQSIQRLCSTRESDIVLASDKYAPETGAGKLLIAHGLIYMLQQRSGGQQVIQRYPEEYKESISLRLQQREYKDDTIEVRKRRAAAEQGLRGIPGTLPYFDRIQAAFGNHDLSDIRAYTGGPAAAAASNLGAAAYTYGNAVAFRQPPDLRTAAHEATHVVQQRYGVQLADGIGRVGDCYERHANAVADVVAAGGSAEALLNGLATNMGGQIELATQSSGREPPPRATFPPGLGSWSHPAVPMPASSFRSRPVAPHPVVPVVQRDLALKPPTPARGTPPTLSEKEKQEAIRYNRSRFRGIEQSVIKTVEDVTGVVSRERPEVDIMFVSALARWQSWFNLQPDGKMTPMTARTFASELRAEARPLNISKEAKQRETGLRIEAVARILDERVAAGPFRQGGAQRTLSTTGWTPPRDENVLRKDVELDLEKDPAAAVPRWLARAYVIRSSINLNEGERGQFLVEISARFAGKGKMDEAMEVVSLIDVVSKDAREKMGEALQKLGASAATNVMTAKNYFRALLRITGVAFRDVHDPQAWLEMNTEAVGRAIRSMERVLGSEVARQLTSSVLKSFFVRDPAYKTDPRRAGYIGHLPKDPKAGNRLRADCDVYAVYGMRLLRAQGWETVGYFAFQGQSKDDIAHAVGLARREVKGNKEYLVVDSSEPPSYLRHLGNLPNDEAAKRQADVLCGSNYPYPYHYYAPAIRVGEFDLGLHDFHPDKLQYHP